MLRFPLKKTVLLITTAGCITCKITKATTDFLYCEDAVYDDMDLNNIYVDRASVVAFTLMEEEKKEEDLLGNKIQNTTGKIIRFQLLRKANS